MQTGGWETKGPKPSRYRFYNATVEFDFCVYAFIQTFSFEWSAYKMRTVVGLITLSSLLCFVSSEIFSAIDELEKLILNEEQMLFELEILRVKLEAINEQLTR